MKLKNDILFEDFLKADMRIGTIIKAEVNAKALKSAYVLTIDFGPAGIKKSSAQITDLYQPQDLEGLQVVGILNFPPKLIAGVKSEVLILGATSEDQKVVLLKPTMPVANGSFIS